MPFKAKKKLINTGACNLRTDKKNNSIDKLKHTGYKKCICIPGSEELSNF